MESRRATGRTKGDATRNFTRIANALANGGELTEISPEVPVGALSVK